MEPAAGGTKLLEKWSNTTQCILRLVQKVCKKHLIMNPVTIQENVSANKV